MHFKAKKKKERKKQKKKNMLINERNRIGKGKGLIIDVVSRNII